VMSPRSRLPEPQVIRTATAAAAPTGSRIQAGMGRLRELAAIWTFAGKILENMSEVAHIRFTKTFRYAALRRMNK
jgi:hypothetical protein